MTTRIAATCAVCYRRVPILLRVNVIGGLECCLGCLADLRMRARNGPTAVRVLNR